MIWHPSKWWYQQIGGNYYEWPGKGIPPGLLDSGMYWFHYDENGNPVPDAPDYYKCLSCCCGPAKCGLPQEIMMTISGFSGTLSSIDRPADYGYSPSGACPCPILWHGSLGIDDDGFSWTGYTTECCKCRATEDSYWWPRNLTGPKADGADICEKRRSICTAFPSLCGGVPQPIKTGGRIAARYIKPCVAPCTDFVWSDHDEVPDYSLVELTDCAQAPSASARDDYNCLNQNRFDIIKNNDSYIPPPGFRGLGAVNLLPQCGGKFWNDTTYYRMCVAGGFWCQNAKYNNDCYCEYGYHGDTDFFTGLHESTVRNDAWRTSQWCKDSPTRCEGPVPIEKVKWNYYRPRTVLISQPTVEQCAMCPGYGFGYGSSFSNYGRGEDWYDPNDDGHCIGKTNVAMEDFNQTFMMRNEITDAAPDFDVTVNRARQIPPGEAKLINAQLLYSVKKVVRALPYCSCVAYDQGYWNIDYPCEPVYLDPDCECTVCNVNPGIVAPKLRAFYLNSSGAGADILFTLKNYCPPVAITGMGPLFNGSFWYVANTWVGDSRGVGYEVGDRFVFSFYENPLRGGEGYGGGLQEAEVTSVSETGEILGIQLVRDPAVAEKIELCAFDGESLDDALIPIYWRFLTHRYSVGIAGNGYQEGDVLTFEPLGGLPNNPLATGGRYYPYLKTSATTRQLARATVLEVDSRGGIVDWYMCGAQNNIYFEDFPCGNDTTGHYSDVRYQNRCEYTYRGTIPVRYAWTGIMDYHFYGTTYCEHAWADFSFAIDQISVKNTITVAPPPTKGGKRAMLRISYVDTDMRQNSQAVDPLRYQNYEVAPGPSANTSGWYKNHDIPVRQGAVSRIEVLDPGSGYVTRIPATNPGDPDTWEPVDLSTNIATGGGIYIRGVTDDIRAYMAGMYGWDTFCECQATIDTNPDSDTFGGILAVAITKGGLWYFDHEHDHIWFAKAGSNWFFELAQPIADDEAVPSSTVDCAGLSQLTPGYNGTGPCDCYHASRDNWGELQHYDGFSEPYPSGYHRTGVSSYGCAVNTGSPNYVWPTSSQYITSNPGYAVAGNPANRWSTEFCPNNLLERAYRMILVHPCAACAKELGMTGSQTCWSLFGYNTGTAMITKLSGSNLILRTSIPDAD